jgi:malate dehydrogenase
MNMGKVSIIGAGNVGATTVYHLAENNEVVMIDVVEGLPQSKAMDFRHAFAQAHISVEGANAYEAMRDSDVVLLTAGIPRRPGMNRMDLLKTNVGIAKQASRGIREFAPQAVVIVVTNPLDVIAMAVLRETGFPAQRVVGMAGVLDATRFSYFIAGELGVWPADVSAVVLGGHGDQMVPLPRYTSVGGFPVTELLDAETIDSLVERTRRGGAEIVNHLKRGSAFFAPAASAASMVDAVTRDEKRIVAASAYLQGEYGYRDVFLGVPVLLGKGGVERIIELDLSLQERQALDRSTAAVRQGLESLDRI